MNAKGKKGNLDVMSIPIYLLVIAFTIFGAYMIVNSVTDAFSTNVIASQLIANGKLMISRIGNTSFIFIALALILFNFIGAFLMVTHPVFIIIDIILLPISVLIASIVSNAYEESFYTLSLNSTFPVMSFIMLHLPLIIVVTSIITAIAAYALVKQ